MTTTTGNDAFQMVSERGWRRGLGNLLSGELTVWFRSPKWWKHILIWLLTINLILFFTMIGAEEAAKEDPAAAAEVSETVELYSIFGGTFVAIGVLVIMQGAIVGEKKSGTAAWVLSKPVSRTAFVVAKLIGNSVGVLFTAVLVPAVVAYLQIGLLTPIGWLPPLNFLAAVALLGIHMFFWLTLTLMLGTFFESWGGVVAVPMVLFFGQQFIVAVVPSVVYVLPWALASPAGPEIPSMAVSLINGTQPFSWLPLISAVVFSILFIVVGIWRFNRQEF